ncbi:NAD(P)H-dependent oxidoreductase [Maribacter sp.]|nr:NAD(P)H-dependent oxidoreductase [Maribacter sp.]
MKKIIALGGSNSKHSINKTLAVYVASQLEDVEVVVVDLNDYDIPLYGIDIENTDGIPKDVTRLNDLLVSADGVVISLAEHNGSYAAAFKSVYDWLSRIDTNVWKNTPMFLMAASPGGRGGATVLQAAMTTFPRMGATIVTSFSLQAFHTNFTENGMSDAALNADLKQKIHLFQNAI